MVGFRSALIVDRGNAHLASRRGNRLSFPTVISAARSLPLQAAVIDGEAAVTLPNGLTSFQALQNFSPNESLAGGRLTLFAFDLIFLDGIDLRRRPLLERK